MSIVVDQLLVSNLSQFVPNPASEAKGNRQRLKEWPYHAIDSCVLDFEVIVWQS